MKILLRKRIRSLGTIGDVVEVKPGYARNYLIPQGLALIPSELNLKRIDREKEAYLTQLAKEQDELQAKADLIGGKLVSIVARSNEIGHLYGSIGPAQIAYALNEMDIILAPEEINLPEPITEIGKYDIEIEFDEDIKTTIHLQVSPVDEIVSEDTPAEDAPAEDIAEEAPATEDAPETEESAE